MMRVRTLFTEAEIESRVIALAAEIAARLPSQFTIVGVLKGSFVFVADLVRALTPLGRTPRIEFIRLSSYGHSRASAGHVSVLGEVPPGLDGQTVLLIDDIVDTGHTIAAATALLEGQGAAQIFTCVLIDKPSRREVACAPDFIAFQVPDVFVVGYGIDYAEQYRYLPYIGTID